MHYFPFCDDPPAPQDPPLTYTPLSPPRPRHNLPSSSRLTSPSDSHLHPQTWPTGTRGETDAKNKARTRVSASSRSPATGSSFPKRSSGVTASLSPPTSMSCAGSRSASLDRRRTISATSVSERRDSVDVDARSIISSLLDAYCQSDTTDDARDDGVSGVYSDEIASLASSSVYNYRRRSGSNCTIVPSELPTRRSKPTSLLLEASPRWSSSASAPQTAPVTRHTRPLPAPPVPHTSPRHNVRPLPHVPSKPPPYTPDADNNCAFNTCIQPIPTISYPRSSGPSSSGCISSTSVSTVSTTSTDLSRALDRPMAPRYQSLPLLTIPSAPSSQQPSPLPSYIPVPPSPTTARRQQASKLSRIFGEDISPEFLGPNRVSRPPTSSTITAAQPVNQRQTSKPNNDLPHPLTRPIQPRTIRPNAIYMHDAISEKSSLGNNSHHHHHHPKEDNEKVSFVDFTEDDDDDEDEDFIRQGGIKIDLSVDSSDDSTASSDVSEMLLSPSDSVPEGLDDMEEARIGWALQNVITYQKAARVKRTSRMWVLEKNGQRWEEQDHMHVRQALRQL